MTKSNVSVSNYQPYSASSHLSQNAPFNLTPFHLKYSFHWYKESRQWVNCTLIE